MNKVENQLKEGKIFLLMVLVRFVLVFFICIGPILQLQAQTMPLGNAHSHNDYEQDRPLLQALENGFTSFEADIHLIDGELYVAHDRPGKLEKSKTFRALYLDPLKDRIDKGNGKLYEGYNKPVYLLVDVKTEAKSTLIELQNQLQEYASIIAHKEKPYGAIKVIVSGNRDIAQLLKDKKQFVSIDGRPSDLQKNYDSEKMPLISENYNNLISWKGQGEISSKDFKGLADLVGQAHRQGKRFRLWATPENEEVWEVLLKAGVDLLNTDDIPRLRAFLTSKKL